MRKLLASLLLVLLAASSPAGALDLDIRSTGVSGRGSPADNPLCANLRNLEINRADATLALCGPDAQPRIYTLLKALPSGRKLVEQGIADDVLLRGRTLAARAQDIVNILDEPYRALPDGVADNAAKLQQAIQDASERGGGRILVPPGMTGQCYALSRALQARDGVTVEATGACVENVGGGSDPFAVRFPEGAVLLAGLYGTADLQAATPITLVPVVQGAQNLTAATPAQAAGFKAGDVVLVGTATSWAPSFGSAPTTAQINVVTSANATTGAIGLRRGISVPLGTGARLYNLSNSGQTWLHAPTGPGDVPRPHWAVRDFKWIGGTLKTRDPIMPPVTYGGLIDSVIRPERTEGGQCVAYGNLAAESEIGSESCLSSSGGAEIALLSHNLRVAIGSMVSKGATNTGRRVVWAAEGARDSTLTIGSIDAGDVGVNSVVEINHARGITVAVGTAKATTVQNAILITDPTYAGLNRPPTEANAVTIGQGVFGSINTSIYIDGGSGLTRRNRIANTRILGPVVSDAAYLNGSGDELANVHLDSGDLLFGDGGSVPPLVTNSFIRGGHAQDPNLFNASLGLTNGLRTEATDAARGVTRFFDGATVTASAPYTATVPIPANVLSRRGMRAEARTFLTPQGTAGLKRVVASFAGVTLFNGTIPASVTGPVEFRFILRSNTGADAIAQGYLLMNGQPPVGGNGYVGSTAAGGALTVTVSAETAGDLVYVYGPDFALRGPGLAQGAP